MLKIDDQTATYALGSHKIGWPFINVAVVPIADIGELLHGVILAKDIAKSDIKIIFLILLQVMM